MRVRLNAQMIPWLVMLVVIIGFAGFRLADAQNSTTETWKLNCGQVVMNASISIGGRPIINRTETYLTSSDLSNVTISSSSYAGAGLTMTCEVTRTP